MARKKLCIVTSTEMTVRAFWVEHLRLLTRDYDVTVVTNTDNPDFLREYEIQLSVYPIGLQRHISIFRDIQSLWQLYRYFSRNKFDLVHSVTPKAGLLAMVASYAAAIPVRIHMFTGQVWANKVGIKRSFLKLFDRVISYFSSSLLADSFSQKDFIVKEKIASAGKIKVPGFGSISGVNLHRFKPDQDKRSLIRNNLGLADDALVFLFLGRLNRDKGVLDLAKAFKTICQENSRLHLLFVGPDEAELAEEIKQTCSKCAQKINFVGFTTEPENYMAASDVFCLPSYREGFGSVIIEAAASGIPCLASKIYGITDAVEDGVTGELFAPGDFSALAELMKKYARDDDLRLSAGQNANKRAHDKFAANFVSTELLNFYQSQLQ